MADMVWIVGFLALATAAIKIANFVALYGLPSRLGRYAHASPDGQPPWALVTGASDGIGRALARELAARGFSVVLHGRNQAKLAAVMTDLQQQCPGRSFRLLVADASTVPCVNCGDPDQPRRSATAVDFEAVRAAVEDLHLTVLVNNAGGTCPDPAFAPLPAMSAAAIAGNVSLNALFPLHLTRVLLPQLRRSGPALVLNVGSVADTGMPLLSSYGASKAFLMCMTETLRMESVLENGGVELLGIRVGRVTDAAHLHDRPSLFMPSSAVLARAALDKAGRDNGIVVGYWTHALQLFALGLLPTRLTHKVKMEASRRERAQVAKRT